MIQPLKRTIVENHDDGTQVTKLPTNEEIMSKINEIINAVNKLERDYTEIKWKSWKWS